MSANNNNNAAAAATASVAGDGAGANLSPYAAMAEALLRGLGSLDAAAAPVEATAAVEAAPVGGVDDLLGEGDDDGAAIDDRILEDDNADGIEIHATGEVDEPMDASAPSSVPASSAPDVATTPAVRPKELQTSGRAQWHAQAAQRAVQGASEGDKRNYWLGSATAGGK